MPTLEEAAARLADIFHITEEDATFDLLQLGWHQGWTLEVVHEAVKKLSKEYKWKKACRAFFADSK